MLPAHPESIRDGASRQLNLFHSEPIHPRLQAGVFSAHTDKILIVCRLYSSEGVGKDETVLFITTYCIKGTSKNSYF